MKQFTVACIQIGITPLDPEANIAKAISWLETAVADHRPDLVVFPETITTGFHPGSDPAILRRLADRIPGRLTEAIQKKAKEHGVFVVWPTYELGDDGVLYNSAALIDRGGEVAGVYRKTHPFPTEQEWTTAGTEATVVDTELGKIGLVICYDGDFPELVRTQALRGAKVVIRPSALLRDYEIWSLTNRARAYDNQIYFIGVNSVGPDAGNNYYFGHSMVVDPHGIIVSLARAGEQIITAPLNPDRAGTCMVQHIRDRNPKAYEGLQD